MAVTDVEGFGGIFEGRMTLEDIGADEAAFQGFIFPFKEAFWVGDFTFFVGLSGLFSSLM